MRKYVGTLSMVLVLLLTAVVLPVGAQEPGPQTMEATAFEAGLPTFEEPEFLAEPPTLTEEQLANRQWGIENTPAALPVLEGEQVAAVGPEPGTEMTLVETRVRSGQPLAPGDALLYRNVDFSASIPASEKSNVMESSVAMSGKFGFYTGNWFAARTTGSGSTWSYINPYADFPTFCCDQVTTYDEARDMFLWLRMGIPDGNGVNYFRLSVSSRNALGWWHYNIYPTNINGDWTNQWWDYPHIQLGARYMYLSWNMFDASYSYVRTVMLRVGLDDLKVAGPFAGSYLATNLWSTFVPVQGAYHIMYWASTWPNSLPQNSRIGIWMWPEDSGTITWWDKTIDAWTFTGRYDAVCGDPNWAYRYDQRVLTGARYTIQNTNIKIPGRKVLGWWWNVQEGGNFPFPYIEGAAFYEDTMTQVELPQGRPLIYSTVACFAYPSITPNKRQDLGGVFNVGLSGNAYRPDVAYWIGDDYSQALPGGTFYVVRQSNGGPSDWVWGDYNTVREFEPTQKVWSAAAHYISDAVNCSNCGDPIYFVFGRSRDYYSWKRWRAK